MLCRLRSIGLVVLLVLGLAILDGRPAMAQTMIEGEKGFQYQSMEMLKRYPKLYATYSVWVDREQDEFVEDYEAGHYWSAGYAVIGGNQEILSLQLFNGGNTGGMRDRSYADALIWDLKKDRQIQLANLFVDPASDRQKLYNLMCRKIRGKHNPVQGYETCPTISRTNIPTQMRLFPSGGYGRTTIQPAGKPGAKMDRFKIYVASYVIASGAAGPLEFEIPVTEELLNAIKPEYRSSFSVAGKTPGPNNKASKPATSFKLERAKSIGGWSWKSSGISYNGVLMETPDVSWEEALYASISQNGASPYALVTIVQDHGFHEPRLVNRKTGKMIWNGKKRDPDSEFELTVNAIDAFWSPEARYVFILEAYDGHGFVVFDTQSRAIVASRHLFGSSVNGDDRCSYGTPWSFNGNVKWSDNQISFLVNEYDSEACLSGTQIQTGQVRVSTTLDNPNSKLKIERIWSE